MTYLYLVLQDTLITPSITHSNSSILPETSFSYTSQVSFNPPPSSFNSIQIYIYPPNAAGFTPTLEASTYLPFVPLPLPEEPSPVSSDPHCAVCNGVCSNAHACPDCSRPVHVICGHEVDGVGGYGSPICCNSCWLQKREIVILKSRESSKRGNPNIDRIDCINHDKRNVHFADY